MKKISILLLTIILALMVTGCSGTEDNVQTATCSLVYGETNMTQEFTYTATNGEINKVKLRMIYDNGTLGVDSFATLTEAQKVQFQASMLDNIGLDSASYEGLEITFEFNEQLSVVLDADLEKADPEILKSVGLDFDGVDLDFDRAIKDMEAAGATCK